MHIHFVCAGNVYRSRFAEAYLRSKQIPDIEVSSSGTAVTYNTPILGPVAWESLRVMKNNNLVKYLKPIQTQTTIELLRAADKIIFFEESNYLIAKNELGYDKDNYKIWEIRDIVPLANNEHSFDDDIRRMKTSEETINVIREKVDQLISALQA